jgi:hypothetical protein
VCAGSGARNAVKPVRRSSTAVRGQPPTSSPESKRRTGTAIDRKNDGPRDFHKELPPHSPDPPTTQISQTALTARFANVRIASMNERNGPEGFSPGARTPMATMRSPGKPGFRHIVLLPKRYQFKNGGNVSIVGIMLTTWGAWGQAMAARSGHHNRARDWRGAERSRKGRNPRKARFFAEQKMRPNNALQGEAL